MKLKLNLQLFIYLFVLTNVLHTQEIFVSTLGSDSGTGSIKNPVFSIEKALELASQFKKKLKIKPQIVYFREGTYTISKTVFLDEKFSDLTFQPYKKEKVRFFGGVSIPITHINKTKLPATKYLNQRTVYSVDLKKEGIDNFGAIKNVGFARPNGAAWGEVFVNKKEMHLSRWPNKDMIPMGKVLDPGAIPRYDDFSNRGGEIKYDSLRINNWAKEKDAWMSGYFMWGYADDMVKIASINTNKRTITTSSSTFYGFGDSKPWRNWYGVNILAELDASGEYYIDREKGILYFISDQDSINFLEFSILENPFLSINNTKNISIKNIIFECSRDKGIALSNTQNVTIKGCEFKNLGGLGIIIGKGIEPFTNYQHDPNSKEKAGIIGSLQQHMYVNTTFNRHGGENNKIIGCQFYQLGTGGVSIGGGNRLTLKPGNNTVENCVFYDLNRIEKSYRPAVDLTGVGNKVLHCEIYNTPSMAIYMHGNNHLIEYNYIHDVCIEAEDQGAFYYGRDPSERGTTIRYNYFENIPNHFNTCAIYNDDGACGLIVDSNVFYKAGKWNVLLGGGSDNIYTNNIFIGNKFGIHVDNRLQRGSKGILENGGLVEKRLNAVNFQKPPYSIQYPKLLTYWKNADLPTGNLVENNVFYKVETLLDGKKEWLEFNENWETLEDLDFVDFDNQNFSLGSKSKIFQRLPNFKEIPFHKIGLYESEDISTIRKSNGLHIGVNDANRNQFKKNKN